MTIYRDKETNIAESINGSVVQSARSSSFLPQQIYVEEWLYYSATIGDKVEIELDEEEIVVRRKKFALVPMNEAEAIEQMKLLGHDNFFIFFDADANMVKVLGLLGS